jgi:hypothetical protein
MVHKNIAVKTIYKSIPWYIIYLSTFPTHNTGNNAHRVQGVDLIYNFKPERAK